MTNRPAIDWPAELALARTALTAWDAWSPEDGRPALVLRLAALYIASPTPAKKEMLRQAADKHINACIEAIHPIRVRGGDPELMVWRADNAIYAISLFIDALVRYDGRPARSLKAMREFLSAIELAGPVHD